MRYTRGLDRKSRGSSIIGRDAVISGESGRSARELSGVRSDNADNDPGVPRDREEPGEVSRRGGKERVERGERSTITNRASMWNHVASQTATRVAASSPRSISVKLFSGER